MIGLRSFRIRSLSAFERRKGFDAMRPTSLGVVITSIGIVTSGGRGWAQERPPAADAASDARCRALASTDFSGILDAPTQVVSAAPVIAENGLPAHCQVTGYVAPNVGFDLRLPKDWNGKFIEIGCGGHCGNVGSAYACPLGRGYACIASDMGHKSQGTQALWASSNLQAKIDWGFRATHVVALAGKAIAARYYEKAPGHSYFMGCSTGGRQGLQEAQRFPWDFDGIVAGAPPIRLSDLYVTFAWGERATRDANGRLLLTSGDLKLLTEAALATCDMDDGVKDGIISAPLNCPFRPSQLACKPGQTTGCLNAAQVKAAERIYSGPTDASGKSLFGGALPGSEFGGAWNEKFGANWERYYLERNGQRSYLYDLTEEGFRYLFFSPELRPTWTLKDFDFAEDYKRLDTMQGLYDSSNPDLSRFKAAGAKMIIYIGMNDISIPYSIIEYYEKVERVMGGRNQTQDFVRLFSLPGVEHCAGGPGADAVDYLTYLENWVEQGGAPDKLTAYHLKSPARLFVFPSPLREQDIEFSRPVYPYPAMAKYVGHGDPNDAANFKPVTREQ